MTLELVDTSSRPFDPQAILRTLVDGQVDFVVIGGIAARASTKDLKALPRLRALQRLRDGLDYGRTS